MKILLCLESQMFHKLTLESGILFFYKRQMTKILYKISFLNQNSKVPIKLLIQIHILSSSLHTFSDLLGKHSY